MYLPMGWGGGGGGGKEARYRDLTTTLVGTFDHFCALANQIFGSVKWWGS